MMDEKNRVKGGGETLLKEERTKEYAVTDIYIVLYGQVLADIGQGNLPRP